jgi:hypothetical protein
MHVVGWRGGEREEEVGARRGRRRRRESEWRGRVCINYHVAGCGYKGDI